MNPGRPAAATTQERSLPLAEATRWEMLTLHIPALGAVLTDYTQEYPDAVGSDSFKNQCRCSLVRWGIRMKPQPSKTMATSSRRTSMRQCRNYTFLHSVRSSCPYSAYTGVKVQGTFNGDHYRYWASQDSCRGKDFVFSLRGSGTLVFTANGEPICALQACMYILQVAAIENVAPETDISVSSHK